MRMMQRLSAIVVSAYVRLSGVALERVFPLKLFPAEFGCQCGFDWIFNGGGLSFVHACQSARALRVLRGPGALLVLLLQDGHSRELITPRTMYPQTDPIPPRSARPGHKD
jgi:hypothetical protein